MSWDGVPRAIREFCEQEPCADCRAGRPCGGCITVKELEVLKLKAAGMGRRLIAETLSRSGERVGESAVRDRLRSASLKIRQEWAARRGVSG